MRIKMIFSALNRMIGKTVDAAPCRKPGGIMLLTLFALCIQAQVYGAQVISHVATEATGNGKNTSITIAFPATVQGNPLTAQVGDYAIAIISVRDAPSVTPATTNVWTPLIDHDNGGRAGLNIFHRIVTGTEPASYTFNLGADKEAVGSIVVYRGVDTSSLAAAVVDSDTDTGKNNPANPTAPASDAGQVADTMVLRMFSQRDGSSISAYQVDYLRVNVNESAKNLQGVGDSYQASTGTTGTSFFDTNQNNKEWSSATIVLQPARPVLTISKTTSTSTVGAGGTASYSVVVSNTGNAAATAVSVADDLPAGFTFDSGSVTPSGGTTCSGVTAPQAGDNLLAWGTCTIPSGDDVTIAYIVNVAAGLSGGTYPNSATADSDETDPVGPDSASVTVQDTADLAVTKTVNTAYPNEGDSVVFEVIATNNGLAAATGVAVTDSLPGGLSYANSTVTAGSYNSGTGVWTIGPLANGASETLAITATVDSGIGEVTMTNSAAVTGDQNDPNAGNDSASVDVSSCPAGYLHNSASVSSASDSDTTNNTDHICTETIAFDWGDLPDASVGGSYPTQSADNGPRHQILTSDNPRLGATIDLDLDGQPNSTATGDDTDADGDDEDGVAAFPTLTQGATVYIPYTVNDPTASDNAVLSAWIDWNGDGDFADAGEQVAANAATSDGSNNLSVTVPADAIVGVDLGVRLRLSTQQNLLPTGPASDGEVEDYLVQVTAAPVGSQKDWGDLPDSRYPTLSNQSGPSHTIVASNPILGTKVDADNDGQPDTAATGDDTDLGGNDDDGVDLPPLMTQGATIQIPYRVTDPTASAARLNAWIDWNGDGDFGDAGEQIATNVDPSNDNGTTDNILSVTVPVGAVTGTDLGVRFRLSTDTGLTPTGAAANGEVEDYLVLIQEDFTATGAIGNYIWLDENSDGFQDTGELGLANVEVVLYDAIGNELARTLTDAQGGYLFTGLPESTYYVDVLDGTGSTTSTLPFAGMTQTPPSTLPGADFGNQDHGTTTIPNTSLTGYQVDLTAGAANLTADFGYNHNPANDVNGGTNTASLGDRVWVDSDGDGAQDPNEVGVSGATVQLFTAGADGIFGTADDVPGPTQTTNANGNYQFDGLAADAYVVKVTSSAGASHDVLAAADFTQTGDPDHFGTVGLNNDNQTTTPVVLAPGDVFVNADFGYKPAANVTGSIGDYVWFDANVNGTGPSLPPVDGGAAETQGDDGNTADPSEYGITGVTVALIRDLDGDGTWDSGEPIIATDTTDAKGYYLFNGLQIADGNGTDDYLVWVNDTDAVITGLGATYDKDGAGGTGGSNQADSVFGLSAVADLDTVTVRNQDFGYTASGHAVGDGLIGDTIWLDLNGLGGATQDAGEPGIEGVIVELLDDGNQVIATTTTDENGQYWFGGLNVDADGETYRVRVAADNFAAGGVLEGIAETYAAGATEGGNQGAEVTLSSASPINLAQDFSYVATTNPGSIGNQVWRDTDADGLFEPGSGETGIAGVTLDLYRDLDGDGLLDPGETRIATTTTDASGSYLFSGLPTTDNGAGTAGADYIVDVSDRDGLLAGYWHSLGTAGSDNFSQADPYAASITSGSPNNLTADFGYYVKPAALGNRVWEDTNRNGIQDKGEPPIAGVVVTLTITYPDNTVVSLKTKTNAQGFYSFANLLLDEDYNGDGAGSESSYSVSVATPGGYAPTTANASSSTTRNDSNTHSGTSAAPVQGKTDVAAKTSPNTETVQASYDFGYYRTGGTATASAGNYVWHDLNNDGIQDADEPGIEGVNLVLFVDGNNGGPVNGVFDEGEQATGAIGTNSAVPSKAVTGPDGYYLFTNIPPGTDYRIQVLDADPNTGNGSYLNGGDGKAGTALDGYIDTPNHIDQQANDPPSMNNTNATGTFDLAAGEVNLASDFGYRNTGLYSITDRVWLDPDRSGGNYSGSSYGGTDSPLSGVTVRLLRDPDGIPGNGDEVQVAATVTTATGTFTFEGLPANTDYVIVLDPQSAPLAGVEGTDYPAEIYSLPVSVVNGPVTSENFPYYSELGRIGDTIWLDNGSGTGGVADNGQQDGTESGIGGVTVELYKDGSLVATDVTDGSGNYLFTDLSAGNYIVKVLTATLPGGAADWTNTGDPNTVSPGDSQSSTTLTESGGVVSENLNQDFGYNQAASTTASISGTVWNDANEDGPSTDYQPETGEARLAGVTVNLISDIGPDGILGTGDDTVLRTTTTDSNGDYSFEDLPAGTYYVDVVEDTVPDTYPTHTTVNDPSTLPQPPTAKQINLADGQAVTGAPGSTDTGRVNFGYAGDVTNPVTVSWFRADRVRGGLQVDWITGTETFNVGFMLWGREDGGDWIELTDELIPSQRINSLEPQDYSVKVALRGKAKKIQELQLEAIDTEGVSEYHGPFALGHSYGDAAKPDPVDWNGIKERIDQQLSSKGYSRKHGRWRMLKADKRAKKLAQRQDGQKVMAEQAFATSAASAGLAGEVQIIQLETEAAGMYRVTAAQLQAAGADLTGVKVKEIAVTRQGQPVARSIINPVKRRFGPDSAIDFYAEALTPEQSLYTRRGVYRIELRPVLVRDAGSLKLSRTIKKLIRRGAVETRHTETAGDNTNRAYDFAMPNGDPWYDWGLTVYSGKPQTVERTFTVDHLAGDEPASLHLGLVGVTDWPGDNPDHDVRIYLNGTEVASEKSDGLVDWQLDIPLEAGQLHNGDNTVGVQVTGASGFWFDVVYGDRYQVSYVRDTQARDNRLGFVSDAPVLQVGGFSDANPVVYGYRDGALSVIQSKVRDIGGSYSAAFSGLGEGTSYWAGAESALPSPEVAVLAQPEDLLGGEADLLIVAHPAFIDGLGPYVAAKENEGYRVKVADVTDIITVYGFGLSTPDALKAYLDEADRVFNYQHVLLVGSASTDPNDYTGSGSVDYVPTLFTRSFGSVYFTPADSLLVDFNDDGIGDEKSLARWPVRTAQELERIIAKTAAYRDNGWAGSRSALLAADVLDPYQPSFVGQVERVESVLQSPAHGPWTNIQRVYMDDYPTVADARADFQAILNGGVGLTLFGGHGAPDRWSWSSLLNWTSAQTLTNATAPTLITPLACYTTYFPAYHTNTLAHQLMTGVGGAVAIQGAITLNSYYNNEAMTSLVLEKMLAEGLTLGEAVRQARGELASSMPDVAVNWTVLGDPTLRLGQ